MSAPRHADPAATTPVRDALADVGKRVWYLTLARGILLVLFGIVAMVAPMTTAWTLAIVLGATALVEGVVEIVEALRHRDFGGTGLHVALGLINIAFGVIVLLMPGISLLVLVYITAFWTIVHGVGEVILAATLKGVPGGARAWGIIGGLLWAGFGVVLLTQPAAGLVALLWIFGVWAIVLGLFLVGLSFAVRRWAKEGVQAMGPLGEHGAPGAHVAE